MSAMSLGLSEREEFLLHDVVRDQHFVRRQVVVEGQVVPSSMLSLIEYLWR